MDFGELLDFAKQNEKPAKEVRCYRTSFAPPKKENKTKSLSANIQKFLARKEEEEKRKMVEADKKREDLLALRAQDSKANKRVRAMLNSTKAANKAVIDDARDDVNTAVTMAGPSQPDEDDYGYVSQEASAFYNKLMDKYVSTPSEDPKFSKKSQTVKDLVSTKDRVRMALLKEEEEEAMGHKRKRRRAKDEAKEKDDNICYDAPDRNVIEREPRSSNRDMPRERPEPEVKKKRPPAPPPMNFSELLKVAAQKQFEPIKIEKKEPREEDERPMTKKQKEEYLREKQHRMKKEEMARMAAAKAREKPHHSSSQSQVHEEPKTSSAAKLPSIPRIPKLNGAKAAPEYNSRVYGSDCEQQMKKRDSQQSSPREVSQVKQRLPETERHVNNSRPFSSTGDKECRSNEVRRNSLQQNNKRKESYQDTKPSPAQNVPYLKEKRAAIEEKKLMREPPRAAVKEEGKSLNPPPKPVIKDERSHLKPSSKSVIKDERGLNNASSKPVIRDDRKHPSNSIRQPIKEERRPNPSESSRVPTKQVKAASGASNSKSDQSHQRDSGNPKMPSNPTRRFEEKSSKNISSGNSLLKDRLMGPNNQSLPAKSTLSSNLQAKKEERTPVPAQRQSNSGVPPKQPPPSDKLNRNPVNRPQSLGSQGPSRNGPRGPPPPEKRRELAGRGEVRRPMMGSERGRPGGRFLPPGRPRPQEMRKPIKRRIESDDEYDSELDDFIDDGPEEGEDYSKYIKEIFGYDKARYSYADEQDEDECMESNFAQQMKEEFVSTKLGIMEDLEDIKQEQMEKKRKKLQMMKKKRP